VSDQTIDPFTAAAAREWQAIANRQTAELVELRRRHQALLDALDTDRTTSISKRAVRAILKGR